jgi:hypothetical protein
MSQLLKMIPYATAATGSRAEMEKRIRELPLSVQEGLKKGTLRFADTVIYATRLIEKTLRMFQEKDNRDPGICNLTGARLQKDQCMLVTGINIQPCITQGNSRAQILSALWTTMEGIPPLASGEFSLKIDRRMVIPETPNLVFKAEGDAMMGYTHSFYKLVNPVLIKEGELIDLTIELGTMANLPGWGQSYIKACLFGTITTA